MTQKQSFDLEEAVCSLRKLVVGGLYIYIYINMFCLAPNRWPDGPKSLPNHAVWIDFFTLFLRSSELRSSELSFIRRGPLGHGQRRGGRVGGLGLPCSLGPRERSD